jgi:hypothetical protein
MPILVQVSIGTKGKGAIGTREKNELKNGYGDGLKICHRF